VSDYLTLTDADDGTLFRVCLFNTGEGGSRTITANPLR